MVLLCSMAAPVVEVHVGVVGTGVARHHHLILGGRDPFQGPGPGLPRRQQEAADTARGPRRTHEAGQGAHHRPGVGEVDATITITPDGAVRAATAMVEEEAEAYRGIGDVIVEKHRAVNNFSSTGGFGRDLNRTSLNVGFAVKSASIWPQIYGSTAPNWHWLHIRGLVLCLSPRNAVFGCIEGPYQKAWVGVIVGYHWTGGWAEVSLADHHTHSME